MGMGEIQVTDYISYSTMGNDLLHYSFSTISIVVCISNIVVNKTYDNTL